MMQDLFTRGCIDVEGFRIHYVEAGSGEPVLFVHGNPTSSYIWRHIMPEVAKSHRAVALDLLGFGKSEKPTDVNYDFVLHASVIEGLIEQLRLPPLSLVLHDWGGPLGMAYALRHPDMVSRLVLMSTYLSPDLALNFPLRLAFRVLQFPGVANLLVQRLNLLAWGAFTFAVGTDAYDRKRLRQAYLEPFPSSASRRAIRRFVQMVPIGPSNPTYAHLERMEAALPGLDIPTLILKGEHDVVLSMARASRLQKLMPGSKLLIIKKAGHFLQEEQPVEVAKAVHGFLRDPSGAIG